MFVLSLGVYLTTTGGSMATDIMTYEVTKGIVERGTVAMSYNLYEMDAHRGVDGRYYAPYGIGHALYGVPFYVAGRAVERSGLEVGKEEALRKAAVVVGSAVATAGIVFVTFWFAWALVGDLRASVLTALATGFATLLWPYSKFGFNAPLATLCVVSGVYLSWRGVRRERWGPLVGGGVALGCALLVRHELALAVLPVMAWIALENSPRWKVAARHAVAVGVPVLAAVLATAAYNIARFGNVLDTGYLRDETAGFGSIWDGALGLLISPGGSVFVYSPLAVVGVAAMVGLWRTDRHTVALLGGVAVVLFAFYATLQHWDADRSYGPRYLLPAVPLLCVPVAGWLRQSMTATRRRLLLAGVTLSLAVQAPGVLVDFAKVGSTPETGGRTLEARRWDVGSSALAVNASAALRAVPRNGRYLIGLEAPPRPRPAEGLARDFSEQFAFSLDFWWMYLFYLGVVPAAAALLLGGLPLVASALCLVKLRGCLGG